MDTVGGRIQPPDLTFDRLATADGAACLAVTGEVDMTTGESFRRALLAVLDEPGVKRLLLNLTGLRFIDSNGVAVLVSAHRLAAERGVSVEIVEVHEPVRQVLTMLGVYEMFTG